MGIQENSDIQSLRSVPSGLRQPNIAIYDANIDVFIILRNKVDR